MEQKFLEITGELSQISRCDICGFRFVGHSDARNLVVRAALHERRWEGAGEWKEGSG